MLRYGAKTTDATMGHACCTSVESRVTYIIGHRSRATTDDPLNPLSSLTIVHYTFAWRDINRRCWAWQLIVSSRMKLWTGALLRGTQLQFMFWRGRWNFWGKEQIGGNCPRHRRGLGELGSTDGWVGLDWVQSEVYGPIFSKGGWAIFARKCFRQRPKKLLC